MWLNVGVELSNWIYGLAFLPFVVFFGLMLVKRLSLVKVSGMTLLLVMAMSIVFWQVRLGMLGVAGFRGVLVAFDIFLIIAGAIFFLEVLKENGVIAGLVYHLGSVSKDYRVQVIMLAWMVENFFEGIAGFGVPAALVTPLLVGLGLSPLKAVVLGLLGNSTAGAFGASGTPTRVGFGVLSNAAVVERGAMFNMVGMIVPVFMLWILVSGSKERRREFIEAWPFALWSGVVFVVPAYLFSFLGQEFPSILGSMVGMLVLFLSTKIGFLVPKKERWLKQVEYKKVGLSLIKVLAPYLLVVVWLVGAKAWLGSVKIEVPWSNGYGFSVYNPGWLFLVSGLMVMGWMGGTRKGSGFFKTALRGAWGPFVVIVLMSVMVQVMTNSGDNAFGWPSMIEMIAGTFRTRWLPLLTPFIGALGSFITGSVTISSLLFGNFWQMASVNLGMEPETILALGLVGAAAGNMIALADVMAAEAVVGLKNMEREVVKGVLIPCLVYLLLVGVWGMVWVGG